VSGFGEQSERVGADAGNDEERDIEGGDGEGDAQHAAGAVGMCMCAVGVHIIRITQKGRGSLRGVFADNSGSAEFVS
jgi:hypothetical protein